MTKDRKPDKKDKKHKKTKNKLTHTEQPPLPPKKPPQKFVPHFTDSEEEDPVVKDEQSNQEPIEKVILPTEPQLDVG